jgi:hypothetical protein
MEERRWFGMVGMEKRWYDMGGERSPIRRRLKSKGRRRIKWKKIGNKFRPFFAIFIIFIFRSWFVVIAFEHLYTTKIPPF